MRYVSQAGCQWAADSRFRRPASSWQYNPREFLGKLVSRPSHFSRFASIVPLRSPLHCQPAQALICAGNTGWRLQHRPLPRTHLRNADEQADLYAISCYAAQRYFFTGAAYRRKRGNSLPLRCRYRQRIWLLGCLDRISWKPGAASRNPLLARAADGLPNSPSPSLSQTVSPESVSGCSGGYRDNRDADADFQLAAYTVAAAQPRRQEDQRGPPMASSQVEIRRDPAAAA